MTANHDGRRGKQLASTILAALAGIALTAGGAAADEYESQYLEDDDDLFGYYDAGFDDVNENDDWFYDYYELDSGIESDAFTTSDTEIEPEPEPEPETTDTLDYDDADEEGLFDW